MTFNAMQARDQADEENEFVAVAVAGYLIHHKLQDDRSNAVEICRDVLCHFSSKYLPATEQADLIVGKMKANENKLNRVYHAVVAVITDARAQFRAFSAGVRYV